VRGILPQLTRGAWEGSLDEAGESLWLDLSENGLDERAGLEVGAWLQGGGTGLRAIGDDGDIRRGDIHGGGGGGGGGSSGGAGGRVDASVAVADQQLPPRVPARLRYRFYCALNRNRLGDAGALAIAVGLRACCDAAEAEATASEAAAAEAEAEAFAAGVEARLALRPSIEGASGDRTVNVAAAAAVATAAGARAAALGARARGLAEYNRPGLGRGCDAGFLLGPNGLSPGAEAAARALFEATASPFGRELRVQAMV
jgi:hypothetical protein